jgi:galactose mutarotase-like enzyme
MANEPQSSPNVCIASAGLRAEISPRGAELVRLQDEAGRDLLWNGDPAFWTGRAPLLFPIVGRVAGDHLKVANALYPMRQHGFARQSSFEILLAEPAHCRMALVSNEESLRIFPFAFRFEAGYALEAQRLVIVIDVHNLGSEPMPVSMGFHPALRWPLPYGASRAAHRIVFAEPEPEPIRRLENGLLSPLAVPTPVDGRSLALDDALFAHDALIFDRLTSRALRYGPPQGRGIEVEFPAMPQLGIWTKPGAGFLCIEPWQGFADPQGFAGEFADKPGIVRLGPGEVRRFGMTITLDPA